jgi:crotonobetainyl-CoA:carnitine CoA-transferase CaiB-like acyl-CoA transferase
MTLPLTGIVVVALEQAVSAPCGRVNYPEELIAHPQLAARLILDRVVSEPASAEG